MTEIKLKVAEYQIFSSNNGFILQNDFSKTFTRIVRKLVGQYDLTAVGSLPLVLFIYLSEDLGDEEHL